MLCLRTVESIFGSCSSRKVCLQQTTFAVTYGEDDGNTVTVTRRLVQITVSVEILDQREGKPLTLRARLIEGHECAKQKRGENPDARIINTTSGAGLQGSIGWVASARDNAAMESFFALLQKNVLDRKRWRTREELRIAIITWIERTYHRRRRQARGTTASRRSPGRSASAGRARST